MKKQKLKKLPRLGYYSSKPTHKNDALWTQHKTITIGDPYNKKHKPDSRVIGRQFQVREFQTIWINCDNRRIICALQLLVSRNLSHMHGCVYCVENCCNGNNNAYCITTHTFYYLLIMHVVGLSREGHI